MTLGKRRTGVGNWPGIVCLKTRAVLHNKNDHIVFRQASVGQVMASMAGKGMCV